MKVLVIGSGGREHAIVTSVARSPRVDKIYCAPGNAGIAALAECVPIGAMEFDKLVAFAKEKSIDFIIVGMDDPLVGDPVFIFHQTGFLHYRSQNDYQGTRNHYCNQTHTGRHLGLHVRDQRAGCDDNGQRPLTQNLHSAPVVHQREVCGLPLPADGFALPQVFVQFLFHLVSALLFGEIHCSQYSRSCRSAADNQAKDPAKVP